jgi:alkylation response protein AidB-like acyl-CoA dehydrogenase
MSSIRPQLLETVASLIDQKADVAAFADAGFGLLLVPEGEDGIGGDWGDAVAVLQSIGYGAPHLEVGPLILSPVNGNAMRDGALTVVALVAGALQKAMELSIEHANVRVQFGKALSKQQAVQQSLAALAEEAAAVAVAVEAAAAARDFGDAAFEIAAAKIRANRAAGLGGAIAHQVHGAIGFTQDHSLHHITAALSRWRSAYGNDAYWSAHLGEMVVRHRGAGLWQELTQRSDLIIRQG